MDPVVDDAVCLRQWDYSETSQTAVLFTRKLGIVRVLGKGTKRNDPRFSGGLEVGTLGEAIVHPKETGLAILAGWDLRRTYRGTRRSLESHYAAMFALDVPRHLLSEDEPHVEAFEGLVAVLDELERDDWRPAIAAWLWRLLDLAGYRPDTGGAGTVVGFSAERGGLVAPGDREQAGVVWAVQPATVRALRVVESGGRVESADAERVARLLGWYVREIAGREPPTMSPLLGSHDPSRVMQP
ncbi:MAG: recombination protein O N-terminal domain-containing protein [Planctomycetota bacterium]